MRIPYANLFRLLSLNEEILLSHSEAHYVLYTSEGMSLIIRYLVWVGFTSLLVFLAVLVTRWVAPAAAGSGIPEMKTILRSPSVHKEFVKLPVLVAKLLGLVLALGSRLPGFSRQIFSFGKFFSFSW